MTAEADIGLVVAQSGRFRSRAASHAGAVRTLNEDAFVNRPDLGVWAVADGAGGHQSGEVASAAVAAALQAIAPGLSAGEVLVQVRARLEAAHAQLRADAAVRGAGVRVATTVVVLLARGNHFACLWAGDSRAYLLRNGALTAITHDHSLVQELLDSGAIDAAEAERHPQANVITRAVGDGSEVLDLDKRTGQLLVGDRLLLCSDGLHKTLPHVQLARLLADPDGQGAEQMVRAALAAQVNDNVTAVTIAYGEAMADEDDDTLKTRRIEA